MAQPSARRRVVRSKGTEFVVDIKSETKSKLAVLPAQSLPEKKGAKQADNLARTPLYDLHLELGARMIGFAGYEMAVQYPLGVLKEHLHCRAKAGLFDVSHMGQARLLPARADDDAAQLLETLVPGGLVTLAQNQTRYTQLTDEAGGILDDLLVTRMGNGVRLVVNAARKAFDFKHIASALAGKAVLEIENRALLALQGRHAARVLAKIFPDSAALNFMQVQKFTWHGHGVLVSRCGYTGEDGFEIALAPEQAEPFARLLLADENVAPIGLGARDSLRLEAGLCLYGQDIDTQTTPAEADLGWSIPKRRRQAGDFLGADIINQQLAKGALRKRVGLLPQGNAPARAGTLICDAQVQEIGRVTSGGFGPSLNRPIAMGYVAAKHAKIGTQVQLIIRNKAHLAEIVALPFVPHQYVQQKRGA